MGEKKNRVHQALYRKYRSKSLNEIVGQEHITKTLASAIKQGKISHAYLFTGPRGTGKTSIARILAHEVNNLPYHEDESHLDIIEIDAASNRRIDDVRDLRDKVNIAPISAKYKVYIIDEVHMLTSESFNALLKTLEEPPAHVIFILATTEVHKLPATIISRTQRHSFHLIPEEKVVKHLAHIAKTEGIKIDQPALQLLAQHGGGSFRDSISLLDQLSTHGEAIDSQLVELLLGIAPKDSLEQLLSATENGDTPRILSSVESLLEAGLTASGIAVQLINLLRSAAKAGETNQRYVTLMADLLTVQNSQYPQLKLETILLSVAPQAAPQSLEPATQPKEETKEKAEAAPKAPAEPETPKKLSAPKNKTTTSSSDFTKQWPQILDAIKKKHNPLYTVLRLATPELESEELVLIFSFPFHQKKVDEVKHKTIIAEIVESVAGISITIRTKVDKSKTPPSFELPEPQPDPAHASLISNVQDIMGGGEVVNV